MTEIIIGVLFVAIVVCIYVISNLLKKVEKYEEVNENMYHHLVEYDDFIETVQTETNNAYNQMKKIDRRGGFASDDEVGLVFKQLKAVVENLNTFVNGEEKEEES